MGEGPGSSDMGVTYTAKSRQPQQATSQQLQQVIRRQGSSSSSGRPVQDADSDWNAAESKSSETSELDPRGPRRYKPGRNDDMEEGEEEEDEDDDGDDEVIGGGSMVARESDFATADLEQIMQGLNKWPWMAYPASVANCLEQACRMLAPALRDRVARDRVSRRSSGVPRAVLRRPSVALRGKLDTLFHEGAPGVMEKCLDDRAILRWPDQIHRYIFEAFLRTCDAVIVLASALLTSAESQSSSVAEVAALEQDLKPLLMVLALGFDKSCQYHEKHMEDELFRVGWEVSNRYAAPDFSFKPDINEAGEWFCSFRQEQVSSADNCLCGSCSPTAQYSWLAAFLDYFGEGTYGNGFEVFAALFAQSERLSISLLEALFKPLAHAADMLTSDVGERLIEPCKATLEFIEEKLTSNVDALSDGSRDGSYQALSLTLRHAHRLLMVGLPVVEAEKAVSRVQRQLVESMLQFVSFNKQLSAVREINRLLEAAREVKPKDGGTAVETAIRWMKENDVIERVLRSNLHHKQYVDQVERMMRFLLEEHRLSDEHLDTIWAATEKPDQFEAVKNNIYYLIADLASSFSDQQLDTLFNRFQNLQGRPLADIVKILQLTKKLAQSDTKGVMAVRLLELLWSISLYAGPEASAHALESHALADILGQYASVNCANKEIFMDRCLQMVTQGKCVVSSLQLLKDIIMLEPPSGVAVASPGEALDDTDAGTVPGAGPEGPPGFGGPGDTPRDRVQILITGRNLEHALVTCIADFQQQARSSLGASSVSGVSGAATPASSMCEPQGTAPVEPGNTAPAHRATPAAPVAGVGVAGKQTKPQRALPRVLDGGRLYTHEEGLRARLSFLLWAMQTGNAELSEASVDILWGELVECPASSKDRDLALAWLSEALGPAGAGATCFSATGPMGLGDGAMQLDSPPAASGSLKTLGFNPSQGDADATVVLGGAAQAVVLDRLAKLAPGEFTSCAWRLFYKLFLAVNIEAKTVSRYMQAVGPAAVATAGSVDQIRGLECIWNLAVLSPNAVISTRCASVLCDLYSCLVPQEQVNTVATRCKFVEECMQRLDSTPAVHQGAVRLQSGAHLEEATDSCGREESANNGAVMGAREEEVEEGEADRTRPARESVGWGHAGAAAAGFTPGVPGDTTGGSGAPRESAQEAQGMEVETGSPWKANGTPRGPTASAPGDEPMEEAPGAAGPGAVDGEGAVPAAGSGEPQAGRALPVKKRMRESGVPEAQGGASGYPGMEGTGMGRLPGRRGPPLGAQECARIVQCLHLLKQFISKCEGHMQRNTQPHGASFLGLSFNLHVNVNLAGNKANQRTSAKVHANESLGSFRRKVARNFYASGVRVRLLCDGHELLHDWMTLRQLGLSSDKTVIAAPIHPQTRVEEEVPPERVRAREAEMPGVIMSQQPRTYEVLFTLVEMPEPAVHEAADDVLMLLPTQPAVLRGFQGLGRQGQTLQEDARALQRMLSPGPRLPYTLQVLDGLLIPVTSKPSPKTWRLRSRFLRLGGLQRLMELIGPRGIPGVTNRARRGCYLCCLHILRLYLAPGHDSEGPEPDAETEEGEDTEEEGEGPAQPRARAGKGRGDDATGEGPTQGVPIGPVGIEDRGEGSEASPAEGPGHAGGTDDEAADVDVETHEEDEGRARVRAGPGARPGAGAGAGARVENSGSGAGAGAAEEEEELVVSFSTGVGLQRVREVMTEEINQRLVQALLALSWAAALGHIQAMDEEYPLALDVSAGGVPKRPSEEVNDTNAGAPVGAERQKSAANGTSRGGVEEEGDETSAQAGIHAPVTGGERPSGRPGYAEGAPGNAMEDEGNPGAPVDGDEDEEEEEEEEEEEDDYLLNQTGKGKLHEDDNTIAQEAFELLSWCLTASIGPLTAHVFSLPLIDKFIVDTVLLSPSPGLRRLFAEFLLQQSRGKSVVRSSGECVKHVVFRALVGARDAANQHPALCRLFFELLKHVLVLLEPADEQDLCRQLLVDEAEWVRAQAASPEALASLTRFQRMSLVDSHLVLLQELVLRAGEAATASLALSPPLGQGLISILLARFLFPELPAGIKDAAEKDSKLQPQVQLMLHRLQMSLSSPHSDTARTSTSTGPSTSTGTPTTSTSISASTSISVLTAATASSGGEGGAVPGTGQWLPEFGVLRDTLSDTATFEATCQASETRLKAFSLLNNLCTHSPEAVKEVASLLMPLHFDQVELTGWECLPLLTHRPNGAYLGLKNAGATCYMNAVFQQLYMQPQVRRAVLGCPITAEEESKDCVLYQVQHMFASLLASDEEHYTPKGFWEAFKDYDGQPVNLREHQDAFEFFNRLYDLLDERLKKQPALPRALPAHRGQGLVPGVGAGAGEATAQGAVPTLTSIFGGVFSQQVICKTCPHRSEREEPFAAVSVDVMNKKGLEDSLAAFVRGDLLEADNAYFCEACGVKVDALKRACVKALPPSLIIHLKRFDFDYETMQRLKLKDRFEFPPVLNMMPYTVEGLTLAELKSTAAEAAAKEPPQAPPVRASGPAADAAAAAGGPNMASPDVASAQEGAAPAVAGGQDQRQTPGVPEPARDPSAPRQEGEQGPPEGAAGAGPAPRAVVHRRSANAAGVSVPSVLEVQREAAGGCPADEEETEDGACLSEGNNSLGLGKLGLEGQNTGAEKAGTPERGTLEVDQGVGSTAGGVEATGAKTQINGSVVGNETGAGTKMDVDFAPPLAAEAIPTATPVQNTAGTAAAAAAGVGAGAGAGDVVVDSVSEDQKLLESVGLRMRESGYYQYRLVGVVVHSGTAFAGHYYSYVKERDGDRPLHTSKPRKSRWWSFDDRKVERYDIKNLERDCFGGKHLIDSNDSFLKSSLSQEFDRPNSAYMLFYERDCTSDFSQAQENTPSVSTTSAPKPAPTTGGPTPGRTAINPPAVEESGPSKAPVPSGVPRDNPLALRANAPYILPKSIHLSIWRENLRMVRERNLLDRNYFLFLLNLVASNLDGSPRHSERKKMAALEDPPGAKPSPQRCEALVVGREADETARSLVDLVLFFLCRVYFHAHSSLREDIVPWTNTVVRLLESSETACQLFNQRLASHRPWVLALLIKCTNEEIRNATMVMVSTSLQVSVRLLNGQSVVLDPASGAPQDPLGVDALLDTLLGVMKDVGNVSGQHISQYFRVLIDFFQLGPPQRNRLLVKGAVQKTVTLLGKLMQMPRKFDLRHLFMFLSLVLRASDLSAHYDRGRPYRRTVRNRIVPRRRREGGAVQQGPSGARRPVGVPGATHGSPKVEGAAEGAGEQGPVEGDSERARGNAGEGDVAAQDRDGEGGVKRESGVGAEGQSYMETQEEGSGVKDRGTSQGKEGAGEGQGGVSGGEAEGGDEEEEDEEEETEDLVVEELLPPPFKFPGPSFPVSPETFKFLTEKTFHQYLLDSLFDAQELLYLYPYLSFCSDPISIAILRELMETLFKASTTETRTVLPMLGAVMEVDDLLQIPRQEAILYGIQALQPIPSLFEVLFMTAKSMNSVKRYCILKFVMAQFVKFPNLINKVFSQPHDMMLLLNWLNQESVGPASRGTPGGNQVFAGTNDENTSNRIRRTSSVENVLAQLRRVLSADDPGSPPSEGPPPARGPHARGAPDCD